MVEMSEPDRQPFAYPTVPTRESSPQIAHAQKKPTNQPHIPQLYEDFQDTPEWRKMEDTMKKLPAPSEVVNKIINNNTVQVAGSISGSSTTSTNPNMPAAVRHTDQDPSSPHELPTRESTFLPGYLHWLRRQYESLQGFRLRLRYVLLVIVVCGLTWPFATYRNRNYTSHSVKLTDSILPSSASFLPAVVLDPTLPGMNDSMQRWQHTFGIDHINVVLEDISGRLEHSYLSNRATLQIEAKDIQARTGNTSASLKILFSTTKQMTFIVYEDRLALQRRTSGSELSISFQFNELLAWAEQLLKTLMRLAVATSETYAQITALSQSLKRFQDMVRLERHEAVHTQYRTLRDPKIELYVSTSAKNTLEIEEGKICLTLDMETNLHGLWRGVEAQSARIHDAIEDLKLFIDWLETEKKNCEESTSACKLESETRAILRRLTDTTGTSLMTLV